MSSFKFPAVCHPSKLEGHAFDCRQSADSQEAIITTRTKATNQQHARLKRLDHPDYGERVTIISNNPLIKSLVDTQQAILADAYANLHVMPAYKFTMGVPGLNLGMACKLIGCTPMHGPHCLRCGTLNIPAKRQQVLCWPCEKIVPMDMAGKKCDSVVTDEKTGEKRRCDRPYTRSSFLLLCPNCGHVQHDFPNFGMFRKYVGGAPGFNRLRKGQISPYNQRLKMFWFQAFGQTLKCGVSRTKDGEKPAHYPKRAYTEIFAKWRVEYAKRFGVGEKGRDWLARKGHDVSEFRSYDLKHEMVENKETGKKEDKEVPVCSDNHQFQMAKVKVCDVLEWHFYKSWRIDMGWPVRDDYAKEKLGHQTEYLVEDFSTIEGAIIAEKQAMALVRKRERAATGLVPVGLERDSESAKKPAAKKSAKKAAKKAAKKPAKKPAKKATKAAKKKK